MFDTTDLEIDRLATLTDTNNLSFGLGMRIEDPSMLFKWAPPRYMSGVRRAEAICTCAIALRIDQWGRWQESPIGPPWLLDEGMGYPYGMDEEVGLRAWRLGLRVGLVPDAVVGIVFKPVQSYGVGRITNMFNAIRMACLYMSPEVLETVVRTLPHDGRVRLDNGAAHVGLGHSRAAQDARPDGARRDGQPNTCASGIRRP